jgi:ubiquinone/menaquinone biosynthesis C-methylase UbiE
MMQRYCRAICFSLGALGCLLTTASQAQEAGKDGAGRKGGETIPGSAFHPYTEGPKTRDGIGKYYMGREISYVMGHLAAGWLERPEREREEKPSALMKNLELAPDAVVADIGAGSGYFTFRLAEKVPQGKVFAVDIQPEMIALLKRGMRERQLTNVEPLLSEEKDTKLPRGAVDGILLVDAYHEFSYPREMLASMYWALKPGGRVYLLEYRAEDPLVPIKPLHKMSQEQAKKEYAASGFRWLETRDFLPRQHFMIFERPRTATVEKPADDKAEVPVNRDGSGETGASSTEERRDEGGKADTGASNERR